MMSMKRKLIMSLLAALCFSCASYGWAWSHKLIGYMAQRNCTETTKAMLDRYLDVPLSDISLWMDVYRDYARLLTMFVALPIGICSPSTRMERS